MIKKINILLVCLMAIHIFLLMVSTFTAWPEMLAWPYFVLEGLLPYKNIAIAHTPLLVLDLALHFKILGVSVFSLKVFAYILVLILDVLLYSAVSKLLDKKKALIALAIYIPLQIFYEGNGLWFDIYMGVFALWSFALARGKKLFWAGAVWTLAFLSKQTAVWFLIPIGYELLKGPKGKIKKFAIGVLFVAAIFSFCLYAVGIWEDFVKWAVQFGILFLPKAQGQLQLPQFRQLAAACLPFLVLIPLLLKKKKDMGLMLWTIAGALGVYPRWELFHFQPALPFLAILWTMFLANFKNYSKILRFVFAAYFFVCGVIFLRSFYRELGTNTRFYEQDVKEVANYVDSITVDGEKIFILNYWDSVYALSNTLPATDPWVPQLEWYINVSLVEDEMVKDLSQALPKYIIAKPFTDSGLSAFKPEKITKFINNNYQEFQIVGGVNALRLKD